VVGGGAVGRRKAAVAVGAGAIVTVVDPQPLAVSLAGVRHIAEAFVDSHLDGVTLAFACATPQVNTVVVAAAKARGVLVCSATDPGSGDFVLPSVARRGDLTFAVSTSGASPALAKRIAAGLLDQFDDSYAEWVRVLGEGRTAVLASVPDAAERRRLLDGFADPIWLERIRTVGADVVRAEMMGTILEPRPPGSG
jgi:precorrin-2 dehydrogenase/sirohydrochlorin ferrochelatase